MAKWNTRKQNNRVELTVAISQVTQFNLSSRSTRCCHNFSYFFAVTFNFTALLIAPIQIWLKALNMQGQFVFFPLSFLPLCSWVKHTEILT